jgi:ribosomal protein S18 acetylase RimI-like enzyme
MIRVATERDADAIWAIVNEAIETGGELAWRPGTAREEVMPAWLGPGRHAYVAELGGEIAGVYVLKAGQPGLGSHVANGSYIVSSRHRGQGIGRAMGSDSLERARALGFRAMQFNLVVADNTSAISLWRSLGFEQVGILPEAFELRGGGYEDAYVMFRAL